MKLLSLAGVAGIGFAFIFVRDFASADPLFFFGTEKSDSKTATASRRESTGEIEIELAHADGVALTQTPINTLTPTGLSRGIQPTAAQLPETKTRGSVARLDDIAMVLKPQPGAPPLWSLDFSSE